jgi:hypothetical protein
MEADPSLLQRFLVTLRRRTTNSRTRPGRSGEDPHVGQATGGRARAMQRHAHGCIHVSEKDASVSRCSFFASWVIGGGFEQ